MKKTLLLALSLMLVLMTGCTNKPLELKVMTFNVRYDNPEDGENNWHKRKNEVFAMLKDQNCDLIGTQEVLANQLADFNAVMTDYDYVGIGREDGIDRGEFSAIFFKKDRFNVLDKGNFMLSETPDVFGSKGWDGACERIASWALLQDKATKKEVFFINTHLDHVGVQARREGVNLLQDKAFELAKGAQIILTGDFNAEPESDVIQNVVNPNKEHYLIDSRSSAVEATGTPWTFHDFDRLPVAEREYIDYIFLSPSIEVSKYAVLPMKFNGKLVSDHSPVIAEIAIL